MISELLALFLVLTASGNCPVELVVLGVAQDGGIPQVNVQDDPAWDKQGLRRRVVSLGLIDRVAGMRVLFEATPDFRQQLRDLNVLAGATGAPDAIFLSHAHIGHYTGLMFLGFESMSADRVPVYTLPLMAGFLAGNGPWDQLVNYHNIELRVMRPGVPVEVTENVSVSAFQVPHRREYAETAGFRIVGPKRAVIFIPDIDGWEEWAEDGTSIEEVVAANDIVYVDSTFFDDNELPGRDMSAIPHPRTAETMARFEGFTAAVRGRIRFIHYNHSNPIRFADSAQAREVRARGFRIAEQGERECL